MNWLYQGKVYDNVDELKSVLVDVLYEARTVRGCQPADVEYNRLMEIASEAAEQFEVEAPKVFGQPFSVKYRRK